MEDYICPISFINEKQSKSTELNELFIAGYRDKICTDVGHSLALDDIKSTIDFENLDSEDNNYAWLQEIRNDEYKAFSDSVISYMICNITDLTINTLILFMQSVNMPDEMCDTNINQIVNDLNVRDIIENVVLSLFKPIRTDSPDQIFLSMDIRMSSLYSIIVSKIFDAYIELLIADIVGHAGINILFETLYLVVYGSENEIPKTESYSNKYVFCSTVLREAMDKHTLQYRLGLIEIARNVTLMCANSPLYGMNALNPKYTPELSEFKRTGLFNEELSEACNMIGIPLGDSNDNK